MHRNEPSWWYEADSPARRTRALLAPLGRLYGRIVVSRYGRATPYRARLPVVCVGNFTAGGTGKTPLALLIARDLIAAGERPVFLTRGYGGRTSGPAWVDPVRDTAREVGDEPLLLADTAPTMIARDRSAGARAIEYGDRPASVIIMDDGLQNPALVKDLSIALVDAGRGIGNGEVIPAGPLRAPLEFQLTLAGAVVVNGESVEGGGPANLIAQLRRSYPGPVLAAGVRPEGDVTWFAERPVVAFAGIGNPERFFSLVKELGARIVGSEVFGDHHAFTEADARRLLAAADAAGANLVTTEKDHVRLRGLAGARGDLCRRVRALPISMVLEARDRERLAALVAAALKTGGRAAAQSEG